MNKIVVLLFCCASVVLVACGPSEEELAAQATATFEALPCFVKYEESVTTYSQKLEDFADALELAENTSRASLTGPISEMQEVQREASRMDHPMCLRRLVGFGETYMEGSIDGMIAFLGQEPDAVVYEEFEKSILALNRFEGELLSIFEDAAEYEDAAEAE